MRWNYDAKSHTELTVRRGDEVEIMKPGSKDALYKVYYIDIYSSQPQFLAINLYR